MLKGSRFYCKEKTLELMFLREKTSWKRVLTLVLKERDKEWEYYIMLDMYVTLSTHTMKDMSRSSLFSQMRKTKPREFKNLPKFPQQSQGLNLQLSDPTAHIFLLFLIVILLLSHVWLFCDPLDYSPLGSSVHGIFQAKILQWVAISFSRVLPWYRTWISKRNLGRSSWREKMLLF